MQSWGGKVGAQGWPSFIAQGLPWVMWSSLDSARAAFHWGGAHTMEPGKPHSPLPCAALGTWPGVTGEQWNWAGLTLLSAMCSSWDLDGAKCSQRAPPAVGHKHAEPPPPAAAATTSRGYVPWWRTCGGPICTSHHTHTYMHTADTPLTQTYTPTYTPSLAPPTNPTPTASPTPAYRFTHIPHTPTPTTTLHMHTHTHKLPHTHPHMPQPHLTSQHTQYVRVRL